MNLADLKKPFEDDAISWRVQRAWRKDGKLGALVVPYVTCRQIQDRLDEVCGAENWRNEFAPNPGGGMLCGISIKIGDEWVMKWDGAANTEIEAAKGGLSGAMKRAAVQWGIGRYLYATQAGFANIHDRGRIRTVVKIKDNGREEKVTITFDPPKFAEVPPHPETRQQPAESRQKQQPTRQAGKAEASEEPAGDLPTEWQRRRLEDLLRESRTEFLMLDGEREFRAVVQTGLKHGITRGAAKKLIEFAERCLREMEAHR